MTDTLNRLKHVARIEKEQAVRFDLGNALWTSPALCDMELIEQLAHASRAIGVQLALILSGGGHDAAVFSEAGVPSGMIFIRNRNGSHNPQEAMEIEDFVTATSVLHQFLNKSNQPPDSMKAARKGTKETGLMFTKITDIIRQKGNAVYAYLQRSCWLLIRFPAQSSD